VITVYLQGGMGNQMFQYATGLAMSLRRNSGEAGLQLNNLSFVGDAMRQYSLGLWDGLDTVRLTHDSPGQQVREQGMPYNPELLNRAANDCTLRGYWQTEKYFSEIKGLLQSIFEPRPLSFRGMALLDLILHAKNSVFLTVRRTDYLVKQDFHGGMLPMTYYLDALAVIAATVPNPHVFVFSDDVAWVEEHFKIPYKMTVAGNYDFTTAQHLGREDEELWLMRHCRHCIMANSSYSWWGAWLGEDGRDKIVIAPKKWFGPGSNEDPRDIVPERWIKL
jgi:glycosyl transferase family 11